MAHNFPTPDEAQLEKLVVSVYERLPVVEISRLNRIEERITRKLLLKKPERKVNTLPWWIVLLLAGGFAAAAWWAGEMMFEKTETSNINEQSGSKAPVNQDREMIEDTEADSNEQKNDMGAHKDKSPVIYRRENF
jgi:hypothetical protein